METLHNQVKNIKACRVESVSPAGLCLFVASPKNVENMEEIE
jgi:hypothetical protein